MLGQLISFLVAGSFILAGFSINAVSAEIFDYKCYVKLTNKQARITNQFASSAIEAKKNITSRFARMEKNKQANNKKSYKISEITECVQVQNEFSSYEAIKLDRVTPQ